MPLFGPLIKNDNIRPIISSIILVFSLIGGCSCFIWCIIKKEEHNKIEEINIHNTVDTKIRRSRCNWLEQSSVDLSLPK
jgi:hypothetical protein